MDALQWMGAVRKRVQTADKNITIIHTTPVHQLTSCVFVRNKSINRDSGPNADFIIHNSPSSDGTHSLQRIHWWARDGRYISLFQWRDKLIHISDGPRVSTYVHHFYLFFYKQGCCGLVVKDQSWFKEDLKKIGCKKWKNKNATSLVTK